MQALTIEYNHDMMGEMTNAYKILAKEPKENRLL
jgi:hypothetical protein